MSVVEIRRKFNTLGSRWAFTGPVASQIHASYMHLKSNDRIKTVDVVTRAGNRDLFYDALVSLGFEFRSEKSSRKVLYFKHRTQLPVTLTLLDTTPRHMTYDKKTPVVSLNSMNATPSVRRMVNFKQSVLKLANLNNLN